MFNFIVLIALSASLIACGEPQKSVEYFVAHEAEIGPKLEQCAEDAGVSNCEAAGEAQANLSARRNMAERQRQAAEAKRRFMDAL